MLAISGLAYRYAKRPILSDISLTVAAGEVVALIGPNGAGKSTLIKCCNRILRPNAGSIALAGKPLESYDRGALARTISYVPQHVGHGMSMRVFEMVALGRYPHRGMTSKNRETEVIAAAIERLGLTPLSLRPLSDLSGGERQRVLIARALAQEGKMMLLDEPTSSLDPYHQLETLALLREIVSERNIAGLVVLHDLALAARSADRLVLMSEGRVRVQGDWHDVLTPSHLQASYGVNAIVGSDRGWPYVIPVPRGNM
jgi:iron complex transport system ATP-binding protein